MDFPLLAAFSATYRSLGQREKIACVAINAIPAHINKMLLFLAECYLLIAFLKGFSQIKRTVESSFSLA